ncbi:MAG: VTT domain-containing protein [Candidatus Liptonbacteria bacterium]|nr:VTT domain-containing protein [Candidatus Liptonbacteria bacterium]
MGDALTNISLLAGQNRFLAYFIIYFATIFLGNISAFASFWIAFRGFFGPWGVPLLILTIFAADMSGDILWYSLGSTLRDTRLGNFLKNHLPRHRSLEKRVHRNSAKWVLFSKFLYASSFPVIFLVGWMRVDFKKFFKASIFSILTWVPILTILAYVLVTSLTPLNAVAVFKKFEVAFIIGIALFFALDYLVVMLVRKLFSKELENGEEETASM